jgi:hypothetical protein
LRKSSTGIIQSVKQTSITSAENTLPVNCEPPTLNEARKAMATLKNGKAPGTYKCGA